jgi:hypothetical protein
LERIVLPLNVAGWKQKKMGQPFAGITPTGQLFARTFQQNQKTFPVYGKSAVIGLRMRNSEQAKVEKHN